MQKISVFHLLDGEANKRLPSLSANQAASNENRVEYPSGRRGPERDRTLASRGKINWAIVVQHCWNCMPWKGNFDLKQSSVDSSLNCLHRVGRFKVFLRVVNEENS